MPLEDTETWQLENAGQGARLPAMLDRVGLRVAHVALGRASGVSGKGPAIVTKAGAFGNEHALLGAYLPVAR